MSEPSPPQPLPPFLPHPFEEEVDDDWRWIYEGRPAGRFDDYVGQYVAVLGKTILGTGWDPEQLEKEMIEKFNLNPQRLVIFLND